MHLPNITSKKQVDDLFPATLYGFWTVLDFEQFMFQWLVISFIMSDRASTQKPITHAHICGAKLTHHQPFRVRAFSMENSLYFPFSKPESPQYSVKRTMKLQGCSALINVYV